MQLNLPEKRYYKIGEVAEAFGVNTSLIRFWEKEFASIKPKKNAKGDRRFTPEDVQQFKRIYELVKERGFTLEGAKTELSKSRNLYQSNETIVSRLERIKSNLIDLKNNLNRKAQ